MLNNARALAYRNVRLVKVFDSFEQNGELIVGIIFFNVY